MAEDDRSRELHASIMRLERLRPGFAHNPELGEQLEGSIETVRRVLASHQHVAQRRSERLKRSHSRQRGPPIP